MTGLAAVHRRAPQGGRLLLPLRVPALPVSRAYAEQQGEWLSRLTRATGLERAVITDSRGLVYASSQNLIGSGEEIAPTWWIRPCSRRGHGGRAAALLHALAEIDGVHFQSLYYPFVLQDKRHWWSWSPTRTSSPTWSSSAPTWGSPPPSCSPVFALLAAGLLPGKAFQAALAVSRRNEHLAFLGRTSAELAHELKNPLAIMKASVDVLRNKFDPEGASRPSATSRKR